MLKKIFLFSIVFLFVGLTLVQAQDTKRMQQIEKELEQIGNAVNARGGKPTQQEINRVQELATELLMLSGMTRAQAQEMAKMMVEEMKNPTITKNFNEDKIDPELAKKIAEQEQMLKQYEQMSDPKYQQQLKQQETERLKKEQEEKQKFPGESKGWPTAAWFREREETVPNLKQPAGTNASFDGGTVYLTGANANTLQNIKQQIETATKKKMTGSGNSYRLQTWVDGTGKFSKDIIITLEGNVLTINFRYG